MAAAPALLLSALNQAPNYVVWLLFLLLFVPIWRSFARLLDELRERTYGLIWYRRNKWQRCATATIVIGLLYLNRAAFAQHLDKYLTRALPDLIKVYFGPVLDVDPNLPVRLAMPVKGFMRVRGAKCVSKEPLSAS